MDRFLAIDAFVRVAETRIKRNVLAPGEFIEAIELPRPGALRDNALRLVPGLRAELEQKQQLDYELKQALENCKSYLMDNGLLILSQAFLKEQRYAKDIADGFDGALKLLMNYPGLRLIEAHYEDTGLLPYYDGLIILRKVK